MPPAWGRSSDLCSGEQIEPGAGRIMPDAKADRLFILQRTVRGGREEGSTSWAIGQTFRSLGQRLPMLGQTLGALGQVLPTLGQVVLALGQAGPSLGHIGPTLGQGGLSLGHVGPTLGRHGLSLGQISPRRRCRRPGAVFIAPGRAIGTVATIGLSSRRARPMRGRHEA
jgi:hypothetical protein